METGGGLGVLQREDCMFGDSNPVPFGRDLNPPTLGYPVFIINMILVIFEGVLLEYYFTKQMSRRIYLWREAQVGEDHG